MKVFIWSGCDKLQRRYWLQSVLLVCKSVVIEPFSKMTLRAKTAFVIFLLFLLFPFSFLFFFFFFFFFDGSYVNRSFGKKLSSPYINLFTSASTCVQIKKYIVKIFQQERRLKLLRFKRCTKNEVFHEGFLQ